MYSKANRDRGILEGCWRKEMVPSTETLILVSRTHSIGVQRERISTNLFWKLIYLCGHVCSHAPVHVGGVEALFGRIASLLLPCRIEHGMSGLAASPISDRDFSPALYNNNIRFYGTKEKLQWVFEKWSCVCKSDTHVLGRCWSWKLIHFFQILEDGVRVGSSVGVKQEDQEPRDWNKLLSVMNSTTWLW